MHLGAIWIGYTPSRWNSGSPESSWHDVSFHCFPFLRAAVGWEGRKAASRGCTGGARFWGTDDIPPHPPGWRLLVFGGGCPFFFSPMDAPGGGGGFDCPGGGFLGPTPP